MTSEHNTDGKDDWKKETVNIFLDIIVLVLIVIVGFYVSFYGMLNAMWGTMGEFALPAVVGIQGIFLWWMLCILKKYGTVGRIISMILLFMASFISVYIMVGPSEPDPAFPISTADGFLYTKILAAYPLILFFAVLSKRGEALLLISKKHREVAVDVVKLIALFFAGAAVLLYGVYSHSESFLTVPFIIGIHGILAWTALRILAKYRFGKVISMILLCGIFGFYLWIVLPTLLHPEFLDPEVLEIPRVILVLILIGMLYPLLLFWAVLTERGRVFFHLTSQKENKIPASVKMLGVIGILISVLFIMPYSKNYILECVAKIPLFPEGCHTIVKQKSNL